VWCTGYLHIGWKRIHTVVTGWLATPGPIRVKQEDSRANSPYLKNVLELWCDAIGAPVSARSNDNPNSDYPY
jgi:hypothetical protein